MNPLTQSKNTTILPVLIALTLGCFGLLPHARATCQEGCSPAGSTVLGEDALSNLAGGVDNAAIGYRVLLYNTSGSYNTAIGFEALASNTTGNYNTAVATLLDNTTGSYNTAIGFEALGFNTTGNRNTANGDGALFGNTTGDSNIAVGFYAGSRCNGNASNNIIIGNQGMKHDSRTIRIGDPAKQNATYMAGISGATVAGGVGVIIDSDGHLGTMTSSARFKDAIKPMDKASEAILALKPVTFHYEKELDPKGIPQFGLVAEDVEKVNPDLVVRDKDGKPYSVRYEQVNAMLLNEFLKEHKTVQEQGATITRLEKQIDALTAGLQKVSAELELSKAAPQTVLNDP